MFVGRCLSFPYSRLTCPSYVNKHAPMHCHITTVEQKQADLILTCERIALFMFHEHRDMYCKRMIRELPGMFMEDGRWGICLAARTWISKNRSRVFRQSPFCMRICETLETRREPWKCISSWFFGGESISGLPRQ